MWLTKRFKYDIFIHIFVLVTHDNVLLKAKLHDYIQKLNIVRPQVQLIKVSICLGGRATKDKCTTEMESDL